MEESTGDFIENIQRGLNAKLKFINEKTISNFKASVPEYRENLSTIVTGLFNAGLLEKDLYKSTQKIHELKIPSMEPIDASNKDSELSFRLYNYLSQFEYIEKDLKLSVDQLSIDEVDELIRFFNYISWARLSQSSPSPVESHLSIIEKKITDGDNKILKGIFRDSKARLQKLETYILTSLEDIRVYLQERYKLEVRQRVKRSVINDEELSKKKTDEALLVFKKQVKVEMGEVSLKSDLLRAILEEDYSQQAESLRAETLKRLSINNTVIKTQEKKKVKEKKESKEDLLIEGFKLLSASGSSLIEISKKLTHNADVIESGHKGVLYKILQFLFGKSSSSGERIYDIVVFFAGDESGQRIKVDLDALAEDLTKTGYKLVLVGNRNSKTFLSLMQMTEKRKEEILTRYIQKIAVFQSKLPALDLYMKENSSNAMKSEMKGFKLDLNDVQSCLNKANKRRLEYISAQPQQQVKPDEQQPQEEAQTQPQVQTSA